MNTSESYSRMGDVTDTTNLLGSLSHSLSTRLIPSGAWESKIPPFLYTCGISIALVIHSFDPTLGLRRTVKP